MERDGKALDLEKTAAAMSPYVDAGLTTFDMADHYGSAELVAGLFGAKNADKSAQMLTKWVPSPGPVTRADVRTAVGQALRNLRRERLDLLQFHTWAYDDPSWLDCMFWLQELKEEGLIGHLGLTNFDAAHLRMLLHSGVAVVSNQVSYSLLDQRARHELTQLCLAHDIKLLAYGTVAGGLLTEKWLGRPEPSAEEIATWSQAKYHRFITVAGGWQRFQHLLATLAQVADTLNVSIANVASRFILEQPAVGGVIIGARLGERAHIEETLRLFSFSLDQQNREKIEQALSELSPIPGDCGDEYRKPPFLTASGDLSHHLQALPRPYPSELRPNGRELVLTGTPWEKTAGYCRAVRTENRILVSGTTATHGDRAIGGHDVAAQLTFVIDKISGSLRSLGSSLDDVVRTRLYLRDTADWEAAARVHGLRFQDVLPANTLVQAQLVGAEYLVEMEAEAVIR
jgi:aryl-alcohol dehydrogenase-like predicted oxidoreductase/enamine deaminase RidA (YjgF/YER057c/UK114 family)